MSRANVFDPDFDTEMESIGFRRYSASVGAQAGAQRLGASLYELGPGETSVPFHYHRANEETLIVLRGRLNLRTSEGWRKLDEGEVVSFATGPQGAHQMMNRGAEPVRFLVLSEKHAPDVAIYPDSGKVGVLDRPQGEEEALFARVFRLADSVEYMHGEQAPDREI